MPNDEQDTIAHLLQVEEEAAELISQAQIEKAHKNHLDEYKSQIEQTPKDIDTFNKFLEKIL